MNLLLLNSHNLFRSLTNLQNDNVNNFFPLSSYVNT